MNLARPRIISLLFAVSVSAAVVLCFHDAANAIPTTWTGLSSDRWSDPGNWTAGVPVTTPASDVDVRILGPGHTTNTADLFHYFLFGLTFPSGAPSFTIHIKNVSIDGVFGVTNDSGVTQTLEVDAGHGQGAVLSFNHDAGVFSVLGNVQIDNDGSVITGDDPHSGGATTFNSTSSAGSATMNNHASQAFETGAGNTLFRGNSTAGNATVNNFGGVVDRSGGGLTQFFDGSSAGSATINNIGASGANASAGRTFFSDASMAGSAVITNGGAGATGFFAEGFTDFGGTVSAENATIINNGGTAASAVGGQTQFDSASTAGHATIVNNGGAVDFALGGETFFNGGSAGNAHITNNGAAGSFAGGGSTRFFSGTAGSAFIINNGTVVDFSDGGLTDFHGTSTAAGATITNNGAGSSDAGSGVTKFFDMSTAGNGTLINNAAALALADGGQIQFIATSSAGSATITNNGGTVAGAGGGFTTFFDTSTAGSATIIANGGTGGGFGGRMQFLGGSDGGIARAITNGNGSVDIGGLTTAGMNIGSIEGGGNYFLGSKTLSTGGNNLSTTVSGVIQDGGSSGGTGGALTKVGTGALTLSGTNTYTGATAVNAGTLIVNGSIASSPGVAVAGRATLGGHGNVSAISGAGNIAPGNSPGILTATRVDPSGGMSFTFDFTQAGSPTYGNAAASGNDVLRLTDTTPFSTALTSRNQVTVDFSGASLQAGELFRGGFFTDSATATSTVGGADFLYTGSGGFTVQFDGFVAEPIAAFGNSPVVDGTVLQFEISGTGAAVPEPSTGELLLVGLAATVGLHRLNLRRKWMLRPKHGPPQTLQAV